MHTQAIEIHEPEHGLRCSIVIEAISPRVCLTLHAHEGGVCSSRYEGAVTFERVPLLRALARLERRIDQGGARKPMHDLPWPHRPLRLMRKNCFFLGSLRGVRQARTLRGDDYERAIRWRLALVPGRKGHQVIELAIDDLESSGVHVPLRMITALRHALERIVSGREQTPKEQTAAARLFSAALREHLDTGVVKHACCDQCHGPIHVAVGKDARHFFQCPCGRYSGAI